MGKDSMALTNTISWYRYIDINTIYEAMLTIFRINYFVEIGRHLCYH